MGTNVLGDNIYNAMVALVGADKQDRTKLMRAMGNAIEDWTGFAAVRTAGDAGVGAIKYNGTTQASGQMDGGTTAPSHTPRLNFDGLFYATDLRSSSSRKTKRNIKTCIRSATAFIKKLKIVEWERDNRERGVGFISEDSPTLVSGKEHDCMNIPNTLGLVLKMLQELDTRINKLEKK